MDNETIKEVRVEILRYLYARPTAAMREPAILRAVNRAGVECDAFNLSTQTGVLSRQNLIEAVPDPDMPAIRAW